MTLDPEGILADAETLADRARDLVGECVSLEHKITNYIRAHEDVFVSPAPRPVRPGGGDGPVRPKPEPDDGRARGWDGIRMVACTDSIADIKFEDSSTTLRVHRDGSIEVFAGDHQTYDPGTAIEAGRLNAKKHPYNYDPSDPNEGGGGGIYFENEWAAGCPEGVAACITAAQSWAQRMPVARLDWSAAEDLTIRAYDWGREHRGLDRSRSEAPEPFTLRSTTDIMRPADHSHMNRAVLPTGYAAKQGDGFCRFMAWCYAMDARASWTHLNTHDFKKAANWWSIHGVIRNTPTGQGSPVLGREFDGALRAVVAAIECGFDEFLLDLRSLVACAEHVYDPDNRVVYAIPYENEHGHMSSKWRHKVIDEGWDHSIPGRPILNDKGNVVGWDGERPTVLKTFEHARILLGLRHAQRILNRPTLDPVLKGMGERLRADNGQLAVLGRYTWGSVEVTPYTNLILGERPDNLAALLGSNTPWWGDHKLQAYTGAF